MKFSEKGQTSLSGENQMMGMDFQDFIQKEQSQGIMAAASDFVINNRTVKNTEKPWKH
ncbi:hypothetical protein [Bacillus massiliglaciei]|uniref:hypothetical protein n=1 Tax=Bacillus massiliglaciei TaxID=1816693 RepID=UPI0018FEDAB6|nr:hypothetical protein [Bacillus massiliglaciei]